MKTQSVSIDQIKRDSLNVGWLKNPIIQEYLTWQSGIPHSNQTLRKRSRLEYFTAASAALVIGVAASHVAIISGNLWSLPIGWGLTLYGMRELRLPIMHAASHDDLTHILWLDHLIGQAIAFLLWNEPFAAYKNQHEKGIPGSRKKVHHKWTDLLTPGEDTFEAHKNYGFKPGVSLQENWEHLIWLLVNPAFYARRLLKSLKAMLFSPYSTANLLALVIWLTVVGVAIASGNLGEFTLIWLVPRAFFYEICGLLRMSVEHYYPEGDARGKRTMSDYRQMTKAIFCAEPSPCLSPDATALETYLAWEGWALKMVAIHLPTKLFVLTGDSPCHDLHHARPGADWANSEIERQKLAESGFPLTANWGLVAAIKDFFDSLAKQPKDLF
jgi:fatty acid desaturase